MKPLAPLLLATLALGCADPEKLPSSFGDVRVLQTSGATPTDTRVFTTLSALFLENADTASCPRQNDGACLFFDCPTGPLPIEPPAGAMAPNAGRITAATGTHLLSIDPDARGLYEPAHLDGPLWQPGDTVTIGSAGGKVPFFAGGVPDPGTVTITQPAPPAAAEPFVLARDADLAVAWTGAPPGDVGVRLEIYPENTSRTVYAICTFPAAAGAGRVSKAVLSHMPAGTGTVALSSAATQDLRRDAWLVTFTAQSPARTPDGAPATFRGTFR